MSDLRTRIAAALKAEDEKPHICPFDGEPTMASYDRLADAVIRELKLRQEWAQPGKYGMWLEYWDTKPRGYSQTRYITDWITDAD